MKGKNHVGVCRINRRTMKRLSARVRFGFLSPPFEGSSRLSQNSDENR